MNNLKQLLTDMFQGAPDKVIISKPSVKSSQYRKIVLLRKKNFYQIEKYTEKQVFHENVDSSAAVTFAEQMLTGSFRQCNGLDSTQEHIFLISKDGSFTYKRKALKPTSVPSLSTDHNRKKSYLLEEGMIIPPLIDMGIFTKEGKVVRSMYDKFRQINRFVEIIDDSIRETTPKHLNIIDFGCGKSYLTFVLYYYFTEIKHIPVTITGLDLKEDVIKNCNLAAQKYHYDNLHFELGDINGYQTDKPVDMVITLHACDTATDYALFNAVTWNARMIFSVPCCQHELNQQLMPEHLSLLSHYGIIKERFSALLTDSIRGNLLELCGYKTQLLEFIDLSHTPKNILIRAIKRPTTPKSTIEKNRKEIEAALKEFQVKPTLYKLLQKDYLDF